jgi:hypothetical protein
MKPEITNFPPAHKPGTPLGHDGNLSEEEVTHLKTLGYEPQHYLSATGPRVVERYLEGSIQGLIRFDETEFKGRVAAGKRLG